MGKLNKTSILTMAFLAMMLACSKPKVYPKELAPLDLSELRVKRDLYLSLQSEVKDEFGYVSDKCDSVGFSCLNNVGGGSIDIYKSMDEDGRFYRHPLRDCFDKKESASDVSRDMVWMCLTWAYHAKELTFAEKVMSYAKANHFVLGRGDITRTYMTPNLIYRLYKVITSLGGNAEEPKEKEVTLTALKGFEAHLEVLSLLLKAKTEMGMAKSDFETLRLHTEREPRNALFSAVYHLYLDGDMRDAARILLDSSLFPNDKLPSTLERCTEYLFQRDDLPKDWAPCPETIKKHSATDFLFTLTIIEGAYAPWSKITSEPTDTPL